MLHFDKADNNKNMSKAYMTEKPMKRKLNEEEGMRKRRRTEVTTPKRKEEEVKKPTSPTPKKVQFVRYPSFIC